MTPQFIFGGNTGETPESLRKKREIAELLAQRGLSQTPRNIGEGIAAVGNALAYRMMIDRIEGAERAGQSSWQGDWAPVGEWFSKSPEEVAAPTPDSGGPMALPAANKEEFISRLMPAALEASKRTGVDPRIIVAQAAQETGWGRSAPGNNYFGIKSHGMPGGNTYATNEVVNGQTVRTDASFRGYDSPEASVAGYADFLLENPRYKPMMAAQGLDAQVAALGQSGYATDPNYANSVGSIARSIPMPGGAEAAQAGPPMESVMAVLNNPFVPDSVRMVTIALLEQEMARRFPKSGEPYSLSEGQRRYDGNNRLVAEGTPAPAKAPQVETFYDEQTGQEYKARWNPQTGQYERVGGLKAPSGTSLSVGPNGEVQFTQGNVKPMTEAQSKDTIFVTRAAGALPLIDRYGDALTSLSETVGGSAPVVGNYMKSPEFQQAEQAGLEFLQAILRKDTGAAITEAETREYGKVYLPQPGDGKEVLAQKKESRRRAIIAIQNGLSPQAILQLENGGVELIEPNAVSPPVEKKRLKFNPATGQLE